MFGAIAGVPTDQVDANALANVHCDDDAQRERFFAKILDDPRMQEEIDPSTNQGTGKLHPACVRGAWPDMKTLKSAARSFSREWFQPQNTRTSTRPK